MQEIRNRQGKLICRVDMSTKTVEIAVKECVSKIRFSDDGTLTVQHSERKPQ